MLGAQKASKTCLSHHPVAIWEVEEVYSMIGGLCQLSKEAEAAAD
jgi:hypothetical protein